MRNQTPPNYLRKYRKAAGFTQRQVARILGFKDTSMISRWEKGVCLPKLETIFKLAVIYRTMVEALFIDLLRGIRIAVHKREEQFKTEFNDAGKS